jgi:hypothetical protein
MLSAIIAAGLSGSAVAGPRDRPEEIDKVYEFKAGDIEGYGTEINADILRLGRVFGTASEFDVSRSHQGEEKGWLGIAIKLPAQSPKEPGTGKALQAIEVTMIMPGSGAETAGLHEGDLIVGLDGAPIEDKGDKTLLAFSVAVSRKHPGDKLKLRILRGGNLLEREVTINPYPRVASVLKPHPDLENKLSGNNRSLLGDALEKEGLTDEYLRLIKEFHNQTDKVVSPMIRQGDYSNFNSKAKQGGDERTMQTVQVARQGVSEKANAVSPMKWNGNYNPFRLQEVNYVMYNPLQLPMVARKLTDRLHGAFDKTHHDLAALMRTAMDELDMTYIPAKQGGDKPPADLPEYVERLLKAIRHADSERAAVLSVLNADEIDFLYATAPTLIEGESDSSNKELTGEDKQKAEAEEKEDNARWLRFFNLVLKLDIPRLLNASAEVAQALDPDMLASLVKKSGKLGRYPRGRIVRKEKNLTVVDTPAGRVMIGGTQDNTYTEDAALILDLGGNDKYFNHAGGSTRRYPFSVVIDLSGDDVYSSTEDFAQGAGFFGGGFLVDLEGNDRYIAKSHSQGAGMLGTGILADLSGRDQYTAVTDAQGAGNLGVGILAEGGGDDSYFGNYFVQGAGDVKGFGAIVEAGGNDNYFAGGLFEDLRAPGKSYKSMSQGFGFGIRPEDSFVGTSGGIGVIAEAEGNDTYVADYFAQGSSYWFAMGILDDRKGNDRYISGRYSQGAGIHSSAGILIDGEGDDVYLADFGVAQGCGHDYGIGFLLDNGGNDRYIAGAIAQGAGNDNGIGVLSDNGGNDEYYLNRLGQGRGNFDAVRDAGSFGLLFDTGGTDVYSLGGKNNSINYKTRWGILVDTD